MSEIRLQKFLSEQGIASRREAERLIQAGLIRVNGVIVRELGTKVDPSVDQVSYKGKPLAQEKKLVYYLVHKPKNTIVTRKDPEGRKTVYQLIPKLDPSVRAVGRLDFDSEGLLILTNDGDLTFRLTHPSYEIDKLYYAKLDAQPLQSDLYQLERGVEIEEGFTSPAKIKNLRNYSLKKNEIWFSVEIHEGKKRQVRRMFEWANCKVLRLIRMKLGSLELGNLPIGKWRELKAEEVLKLKKEVKM